MQNMNNGNFNPYGYGGYGYAGMNPNYAQPNYTQPSQNNQYYFVNGIEGAKAFQVGANQTVMLLDSDNPIIYKKTSNAQGQSTIQYYKMVETTEDELKTPKVQEEKLDYASKEDINELNKRIDSLYKKFNSNRKGK